MVGRAGRSRSAHIWDRYGQVSEDAGFVRKSKVGGKAQGTDDSMRIHPISGLLLLLLVQASAAHADMGAPIASDQAETISSGAATSQEHGQAPLAERLYMLAQEDGRGDYLSTPVDSGRNTLIAWSWSISIYPTSPPKIDAFLNEYDCAASQFRRLRQERYRGQTLHQVRSGSTGFRLPSWMEMEGRIVREFCHQSYVRLPQVMDTSAAIHALSESD